MRCSVLVMKIWNTNFTNGGMKYVYKITNKYSLIDKFQLAFFVIRTKLICRYARIIRPPFFIRGGGISHLVIN
jgi:hypothetical protein